MAKQRINLSFLWRKKTYDQVSVHETNLDRVLGVFDVTCIGTSFTVAGVYILLGDVVANNAGPGVILSFLIAGFATLLAGLCYAELGSRVPRAGSAYTYIYVTIGEFVAFVMGWDLILEYIIGSASIASSLSQNIDFFFDNRIHQAFSQFATWNIRGLASTPDFLAFALCMAATLLMILGVKESSRLTKGLTVLNLGFLVFAIIVGAFRADPSNWNISVATNSSNSTCTNPVRAGSGGFLPFGFSGVWSAAAKCFYAYIGFDAICASGEEVKNPQKTIPLGIMLTLIIVSVVYFAMSAVVTLMMPYCLINAGTPLPYAFVYAGFGWAKYIVAVGGLISIVACLYSSMYPMPRVVYTMAVDGLIFKPFYYLIPKLKSPYLATLVTGTMASVLALLVDLNELINMISIGTLLAYSIVCICVLILRYRPTVSVSKDPSYLEYFTQNKEINIFKKIFWPVSVECDRKSSNLVNLSVSLAVVLILALGFILNLSKDLLAASCLVPSILLVILLLVLCFIIRVQPENKHIETFKAPLMPFLPLFAVLINAYLIINLPIDTAYRFLVWFSLGLIVYFAYGMRNSKENKQQDAIYPTVDPQFSKKQEELSPVLEKF